MISQHNLSNALEDQLLELAADGSMKTAFPSAASLTCFWIKASAKYLELAEIVLTFPSIYLCKAAFSTMSVTKTKYRNNLDI